MPDANPDKLPEELERRLTQIVERDGSNAETAIETLCTEFPDRAAQLRKRLDEVLRARAQAPDAGPPTELRERIGRYRLVRVLGEGGMGTVYLAEQTEPVRRRVALKVIKLGMDTREVVARFEAERQALALLDHPHVAKVLDAGSTDTGRPYFVMDYVAGVPITNYCDSNKLDLDARLRLFLQVCSGIQHAHDHAIVHRDIKPSNVLVQIVGDQPHARIIDFGVAKALSQRLTERTLFTQHGQMIGTPEYMSPEQAEMTGLDVDVRSDVYSLGVLLYELLVGARPLDAVDLRAAGYQEIQRRIRDEMPPTPSKRLKGLGETGKLLAESRRLTTPVLMRKLRHELDAIAMKALEKDRTFRYQTAKELGSDLGRYLDGERVRVKRAGVLRRLPRLVRRHKAATVVVLAIAAAVVAIFGTGAVPAARVVGALAGGYPRATSVTLSWRQPDDSPPLELLYGTAANRAPRNAAELLGTGVANGDSPVAIAAGDPRLSVVDGRVSYTVDGLGLDKWYFFALRPRGGAASSLSRVLACRTGSNPRARTFVAHGRVLALSPGKPSLVIPPLVFDTNVDGRDDVIVFHEDLVFDLFVNEGGGGFSEPITSVIAKGVPAVAADVGVIDRDLAPDIFVAGSHAFWVCANKRDGTFRARETRVLGPSNAPYRLADLHTGDFDGNGVVDVAVSGELGADAAILVYYGSGKEGLSFTPAWSWQRRDTASVLEVARPPAGTLRFAVVDANQDGCDDLVHGHGADYRTALMRRGVEPVYRVSPRPANAAPFATPRSRFADIDHDGFPDLVTVRDPDKYQRSIVAFPNDRDGGFGSASPVPLVFLESSNTPEPFLGLDVDHDGLLDFAVRRRWWPTRAKLSLVQTWFGLRDPASGRQRFDGYEAFTGRATARWQEPFETAAGPFAAGDLDGDGRADWVALHEVEGAWHARIAIQTTAPEGPFRDEFVFGGSAVSPIPLASAPRAGRFSRTASTDLLLGHRERSLEVLKARTVDGRPTGAYTLSETIDLDGLLPARSRLAAVEVAALDPGPLPDIAYVTADGKLGAVLDVAGGAGTAAAVAETAARFAGGRLHAGVFRRSAGRHDLLVSGATRTLSVFQLVGRELHETATISLAERPELVHVCDLDLDGFDDVVAVVPKAEGTREVVIFLTHAADSDTRPRFLEIDADFVTPKRITSVTSASLWGFANRKSRYGQDLVFGAQDGTVLTLFTMCAGGAIPPCGFKWGHSFASAHAPATVHAADLTNDGAPDLVVTGAGGRTATVYRNDGTFVQSGRFEVMEPASPITFDWDDDLRVAGVSSGYLNDDVHRDLLFVVRDAKGNDSVAFFFGSGGGS